MCETSTQQIQITRLKIVTGSVGNGANRLTVSEAALSRIRNNEAVAR